MKELTIFLLCIIIIFIYMNFIRKSLYLDKVKSTINNKTYYVRNLPDKNEAANKLAEIGILLNRPQKAIRSKWREMIDKDREELNEEVILLKPNIGI